MYYVLYFLYKYLLHTNEIKLADLIRISMIPVEQTIY